MVWRILLFAELAGAFGLLFWWIRRESIIHNVMRLAYENLEQAAKRRVQDNRQGMYLLNKPKGILHRLERQLLYSGLTKRLPGLTPELYITGNLFIAVLLYFLFSLAGGAWWPGLAAILIFEVSVILLQNLLILRNYNAVDENLLKFLDFLGNYSITSGEVTVIISQISGYMDEPLRTVLEECYYEAQTSGDVSMALLSMGEKIQHPKFKELVRNLEISMRYSADFTILVSQSRKSVREHIRMRQERKALASEAWVNILILGAMTIVILKAVEALIGVPLEEIVWQSWVGRGCLAGIVVILLLFYGQIRKIDK